MLRRLLAMVFVTFSLVTVVTQSPANAACTVNLWDCTGGNCAVNTWYCVNGGNCELNIEGYCGSGGNCTVNLGTCYGSCSINLGYCGSNATCTVNAGWCTSDYIDPTVCPVLAAFAGTYGTITITSEGDIFVRGEHTHDCPPYDIWG